MIRKLIASHITITTMESCTGGLLASAITNVSGASEIYPGGYVTYSNEAKIRCGVPSDVIETYGVYSKETAAAMAEACKQFYNTQAGIGITGSLGRKDPNNPDSVSGQVYYGISLGACTSAFYMEIPEEIESREDMKKAVIKTIFESLAEMLDRRESEG